MQEKFPKFRSNMPMRKIHRIDYSEVLKFCVYEFKSKTKYLQQIGYQIINIRALTNP